MANKGTQNKKKQILEALKYAGKNGITNAEMSNIALRYGGYLGELYIEGYKVSKEHLGNGLYNYVLISEPTTVVERAKAVDVLVLEMEKIGVSKDALFKILDDSNVAVRYRANTYNN